MVTNRIIDVRHIATSDQTADLLTKNFGAIQHHKHTRTLLTAMPAALA